jgi:23S rRNA maturation mini-RNase III
VRLADYVLVSGERILRVARAFPDAVFFDPDVALTFRVPKESNPTQLDSDAALLGELLGYTKVRDGETPLELLSRFGSLGNLLYTPAAELIRVGISEQIAVLISLVLSIYARAEVLALSKSVSLDSAEAQAKAARLIRDSLSESEFAVFRRGRNAKPNHAPPHKTAGDVYPMATALEALFGYLYLRGEDERLSQLWEMCEKSFEEKT